MLRFTYKQQYYLKLPQQGAVRSFREESLVTPDCIVRFGLPLPVPLPWESRRISVDRTVGGMADGNVGGIAGTCKGSKGSRGAWQLQA